MLPRSTFGRIASLIAALLLISQFVTYWTVYEYVLNPFLREIMHMASRQVLLVNPDNALELSPQELVNRYQDQRSEAYVEKVAGEKGLAEAVRYTMFTEAIDASLTPPLKSEVKVQYGDVQAYWIRSPYHEHVWVRVESPKHTTVFPPLMVIYLSVISLLSLIGGWVFARNISRPLRRLEFAARELGRGDAPGRLRETGTQELVALTRAFNNMARDLHQMEQDRTMLLAGISHDLRTPLTRIRLASEFLPDEYDEIRDGICRDTEDMDEIIDQFIAFVRDGRDERSEPGDFNALVKTAAEAAAMNESDVRFELGDLPPVPFKALAMKRLIRNLVENALRYAGAPVTLKTRVDGKHIVLSVMDEGPGVNEADIPRLFQPFTRGDAARGGRGTGLGLAIVKRIAEMHRARISLHNRPERGLEARLEIPLY